MIERRWLKVKEVAELMGISVKGAYAAVAARKLPRAKIPGIGVRVDRFALEAMLVGDGKKPQ